jgi:hypothetical protein
VRLRDLGRQRRPSKTHFGRVRDRTIGVRAAVMRGPIDGRVVSNATDGRLRDSASRGLAVQSSEPPAASNIARRTVVLARPTVAEPPLSVREAQPRHLQISRY